MKNQLPPLEIQIAVARKLAPLLVLIYCVFAPEQVLHVLLVVTHTLYESIAFLLEEILGHTFHLRKYHSQLIVFYLFWGVGLYGLYWLWRRLPEILESVKNYLLKQYLLIKIQVLDYWRRMQLNQKIKLIVIHSALMLSTFMLLLS
ncbi:MAG: hypothetical protein ACXWTS_10470 [Methylococcaceae bacterium]